MGVLLLSRYMRVRARPLRASILRTSPGWPIAHPSLLGIECRLPDEVFPSFRVLRDCWISFGSDHEEMEPVQFFKYAIDWNGQFKIFRFYDD